MLSLLPLLLCVGPAPQAAQDLATDTVPSTDNVPSADDATTDERALDLTPRQLPPMVVRAPRLDRLATQPSTQVSVVTRDELLATGERSLPRMIGAATGVWIQETNLGGGSPFIRGLTGNQVLLVIDGVRINDSTTRFGPNQNLDALDDRRVDPVEVLVRAEAGRAVVDAH
ncbi:MAG: Plug domain-containing protein, partial [Planctomycetota bacterium]